MKVFMFSDLSIGDTCRVRTPFTFYAVDGHRCDQNDILIVVERDNHFITFLHSSHGLLRGSFETSTYHREWWNTHLELIK